MKPAVGIPDSSYKYTKQSRTKARVSRTGLVLLVENAGLPRIRFFGSVYRSILIQNSSDSSWLDSSLLVVYTPAQTWIIRTTFS